MSEVTPEGAVKGYVLTGIIQDAQHGNQSPDLFRGEITGPGIGVNRDAFSLKNGANIFIPADRASQQNDNITVTGRSHFTVRFITDRQNAYQLPYAAGDHQRFLLPVRQAGDFSGEHRSAVLPVKKNIFVRIVIKIICKVFLAGKGSGSGRFLFPVPVFFRCGGGIKKKKFRDVGRLKIPRIITAASAVFRGTLISRKLFRNVIRNFIPALILVILDFIPVIPALIPVIPALILVIPDLIRKNRSLFQGNTFVVVHAADLTAHDPHEDVIYAVKHLAPAAEILIEIDSFGHRIIVTIQVVFLHEYFRPGKAEAINALLDISDHESVEPPFILT